MTCTDRSGTHEYEVMLLHEFGHLSPSLSDEDTCLDKITEIYEESKKFETIFSDQTRGDVRKFVRIFMDNRSAWVEVRRIADDRSVGVMCAQNIVEGVDADVHITMWDSVGKGREELIKEVMRCAMRRYELVRLTAPIPGYQKAVGRVIQRLGFEQEGTKRKAVKYNGDWCPLHIFGILREDLIEEEEDAIRE